MIDHITIDVREDQWEELRKLLNDMTPHQHPEGMNECPIYDEPIIQAAAREIKNLQSELKQAIEKRDQQGKYACDMFDECKRAQLAEQEIKYKLEQLSKNAREALIKIAYRKKPTFSGILMLIAQRALAEIDWE